MKKFPLVVVMAVTALLLSGCVVSAPPVQAISTSKACDDLKAEIKSTSDLLNSDDYRSKFEGTQFGYQVEFLSRIGPYTASLSPALRANGSDEAIELAEVFEDVGKKAERVGEVLADLEKTDQVSGTEDLTADQRQTSDDWSAAAGKLTSRCGLSVPLG